ncbi:MAG TPA: hypothetical protein VEJ68_05050, partial [Candidatus Bathyarchaeia archaeon]|nr:hypothetical protein [Candidatus Bathyarchaeia archaeon]
ANSQSISATGTQVWVDTSKSSGWAWGAAAVRNSGDKLLSIDTISIRGTNVAFSNWYADTDPNRVTTGNFQSAMNYTGLLSAAAGSSNTGALINGSIISGYTTPLDNTNCAVNGVQVPGTSTTGALVIKLASSNPELCLLQQSGPISLQPGAKTVIYFKVPQNTLTSVDAGASGSVGIYAGQVGSPITVTIAAK